MLSLIHAHIDRKLELNRNKSMSFFFCLEAAISSCLNMQRRTEDSICNLQQKHLIYIL